MLLFIQLILVESLQEAKLVLDVGAREAGRLCSLGDQQSHRISDELREVLMGTGDRGAVAGLPE